ncbi:zinc-ribbon domain-containing protein [Streptomyces populi]
MPAFCPHCGDSVTDGTRYCVSCGRPAAAPAPAPSPATPPPPPSSPPAAPGAAQAPSAAATALTRLLKGDWIGPARIAALPAALLLLLSLILATTAEDVSFGDAFPAALTVVLSALGARPRIDLTEQGSPLASLELSFVPLGVTLLWAVALWFGARLRLRGAATAGKHLDTTESLFLTLRGVVSAVLGSVLLTWAAGTSVTPARSDSSDASAPFLARLLHLPEVTLSVTCSPLRAAWWTLVLASVVLFPTLCRTSLSAWAARRPGLGDWLRAGRRAGVALAVPLSLAGLAAVVFLVSEGGFSVLIPAVLLAPNLATTLLTLGSGASVGFTDTLTMTDMSSSGPGGDGSETAVSLFDLHHLGGWLWVSVLLGVVAAVVLGAGVLREAARPAAAVRAMVCFVAGFLLLAVTAGISVELSSSFSGSSSLAYVFAAVLEMSPTDGSALAVGPAVPTVLLAATVWAALGVFGVPAVARRLGITRAEDVPGFSALRGRPSGRPGPTPTVVAAAPVPVTVSAPVPAVAPMAAVPLAPPVTPQVPDVADPRADDASAPSAEGRPADEAVAAPPATSPAKAPAVSTVKALGATGAVARPVAADAPDESASDALGEAAQETTDEAAPTEPQPTAETAETAETADAPIGSADEPTGPATDLGRPAEEPTAPADEPAASDDESVQPTPTAVDLPADVPAATPDDTQDHPAEGAVAAVSPTPSATPPAPPEPGPAAGLLEPPTAAHPGARFRAGPAGGAENHAAAFADLPTGNMTPPGVVHPAVHAPVPQVVHAPVPRPGRREIGWGVVTVTLVASAVLAGGVTAAGVWLTSHRSASPAHTTRATDDAVVPGAATSGPPSAPVPAAPTVPSGSEVSPSASQLSPEDIVTRVQALLEENAPQRQRVSKAVTAGGSCSHGAKPVKHARDELLEVAVKRDDLARRVDLLAPQADGDLAEALDDLSRAWTVSAKADRGYASWVSETVDFINQFGVMGCGHSETRIDPLPKDHDAEATAAKQDFAALWNPIALRYGLTEVDPGSI